MKGGSEEQQERERGRGEGAREGRRGKEKAVVKGILAHTRPIGWLQM